MSARTTPIAPTLLTLSFRNTMDKAMVTTGDKAMMGKIR